MTINEIRQLAATVCEQTDSIHNAMWRTPLVATAKADRRFDILPHIASPDHILPEDLLPSCRTVIAFFVPFAPNLSNDNAGGKFPSKDWALAKTTTNTLLQKIGTAIGRRLEESGWTTALTPPTYNFDPISLMAQWSHKHVGYIAGLGKFGINAQLLTPAGCAGRIGSMVTDADLGDHPIVQGEELCLAKRALNCMRCVHGCPVGAVSLDGIDRKKCKQRLDLVQKRFAKHDTQHTDGDVCAKCVAGMPCALSVP